MNGPLSISIVEQVFAISAASIIIVEAKMFQLKATQECTEYNKQILFSITVHIIFSVMNQIPC